MEKFNMIRLAENLYVGDNRLCQLGDDKTAVIHACKECHRQALQYKKSLDPSHPHYLFLDTGRDLYINMIDVDSPAYYRPSLYWTAADFIDLHRPQRPVLIHCAMGISRSPSIALCYMARKGLLPNDSYLEAKDEFQAFYPFYQPGRGIDLYLGEHWEELCRTE